MAATGRFDYLDGIRAVAIGAVLALHWFSWYVPLFHGGSVGVDVFFVLSGFIITTVLWRTPLALEGSVGPGAWLRGWASFLRRRMLRLYPALAGLVVGCVLLYAVVPSAPDGPVEVARRGLLALTQTSSVWAAGQHGSLWLPGIEPFGHTWSLAVEWYFYLLWPLVVLVARARGWSAVLLMRVSLAVAAAAYLLSLPLGTFVFYFGPSARSAELLAGAALALRFAGHGRPETPSRHGNLVAATALVAVTAYAVLGRDGHDLLYRVVGIPVAVLGTVALIHTGYAGSTGPVQRLLAHPWIAAVGRHSYSLYLWHIVPFLLLEDAEQEIGLPKPVLGLIAVTSAVALTMLSYRLLEKPFLRPRSDVLRPSRTGEVSPSPARPASPAR